MRKCVIFAALAAATMTATACAPCSFCTVEGKDYCIIEGTRPPREAAEQTPEDGDFPLLIKLPERETWTADEREAELLAKMAWGEARGCGEDGMKCVMWVALNRLDAGFGDSLEAVITAKGQFVGYREGNPVIEDIYAIAEDVLRAHAQGESAPTDALYFTGDGKRNYFRRVF